MISKMFDISSKHIKYFLDSVDTVLNSNTFILEFAIELNNVECSLTTFLKTDEFVNQLTLQDKQRVWYNMYYYDNTQECYKVKSGNFLTDNFKVSIDLPLVDKREYLIAMLTGDTSKGKFFSYHQKQKEKKDAELIIDDLISFLSVDGKWDLFVVKYPTVQPHLVDNFRAM